MLRAKNIVVSYGKVNAIDDVDLEIEQGQIVTIIGANGAGKSTLVNSFMGVLPFRGVLSLDARALNGLSTAERVQLGLTLVPERRELFNELTVDDNLSLGGYVHRHDKTRLRARRDEVYDRFPILLKRNLQKAGTLSGGERQMLAIGRALMSLPRILMLDEPSLGLAPLIVKDIFGAIKSLQAEGVGILLVEQNAKAALDVAGYAYVFELGHIVLSGPAREIAANPKVESIYLGSNSPPI